MMGLLCSIICYAVCHFDKARGRTISKDSGLVRDRVSNLGTVDLFSFSTLVVPDSGCSRCTCSQIRAGSNHLVTALLLQDLHVKSCNARFLMGGIPSVIQLDGRVVVRAGSRMDA